MDLQAFAEQATGRRINLLFRLTMSHLRAEMKEIGIGAGDYPFMAILFFLPGLSQDELSRQMHVDKSYTARAVAKLEKAGLVERRPDPDEHRIKRVYLTEKAVSMKDLFFNIAKDWNEILVKDIDPGDLKIIRDGMDKMMNNAMMSLYGETFPPFHRKPI